MGACYGGGVMRFDGAGNWRRYKVADGLLSDEVIHMDRASDGSIWATHHEGYSRLDPQTGQWQALPELKEATNLRNSPDGSLWFLLRDALLQLRPEAPLTTMRTIPVPAVGGTEVKLQEHLVVMGDSLWILGNYGEAWEQTLGRYEPQSDEWTMYTYDSTGGAMPLAYTSGLSRLSDEALFVHTVYGGYRVNPGPGGDPSMWRMVAYPQFAQENPATESTDDPTLLQQLIPVRWGSGGVYDTLVR